jgi:hypothetical protein
MLRLIIALALSNTVTATTAPGTGYSDADSCPPPEATPFGSVVTHSCTFCAATLTKAPLIKKDAAWQSVAFANHATQTARLVDTRYCDSTCQHDHWRRGHKQICKRIHRGGNAEQYNADKKYKEAVAVAVEACADDTKTRAY